MSKSLIARLAIVAALMLGAQGCATNPVTGKSQIALSENWELSSKDNGTNMRMIAELIKNKNRL